VATASVLLAATVVASVLAVRSAGDHRAGSALLPPATGVGAAGTVTPSSVPTAGADPGVSTIGATGSYLIIPSLDVQAPLVPTGAAGAVDRAALTIPADVHTAAWWDGIVSDGSRTIDEDAPAPGQPGVALIAGHVDSASAGPGALYDLRNIAVGAIVEIVDSDRHLSRWRVSAPPLMTRKTALPSSLWQTTGPAKLALVTCGGSFDATTGHYLDNVIVWTTPA
jgi:hypothetical protein